MRERRSDSWITGFKVRNFFKESLMYMHKDINFIYPPPFIFEVISNKTLRNYQVDLEQHSCTCSLWQSTGYPCGHALAVLLYQKKDPQLYVKPFFTIEAYKTTYENAIFPPLLPNVTGEAIHSP